MNAELSQKADGCASPHEICFAIWISMPVKVRLSVLCEAGIPPFLGEPLYLPF